MGHQGHRLVRTIAALCVTLTALSGCGESSGDGATITFDNASEQPPEQEQSAPDETEPDEQEPDEQEPDAEPESESESEEADDRSSATRADLDAYTAAAEKGLKKAFGNSFKKLYSDIDIVPVYPNGIEYDYTFRRAVDPSKAKSGLDTQVPTLRTQSRTVVIPEMEQNGFEDPTVTFTYRNPDGSVVWTRTFS